MMCLTLSLIANPLLWGPETFAQDQDVTVPDEKLAAVVREALELDETATITPTQLSTLTLHLQFHGSEAFERDPVEREKWRITENRESRLQTKNG